ncbi:MAG: DUF3313 domain-containing protein, partial [Sphingomicrobium sp.]
MRMKMLTRLATIAVGLALIEAPLMAAKPPVEWDGLKRVVSKRMDLVYVRPNADFRAYSKVMLDPTEVAFQKSWQKDQKFRSPGARVSDRDMQKTISEGIIAANDIFLTAWRKAGYEIVSEPATDVL